MPAYPGSEHEKRVSVDHLNAFVSTVFERCTMSTDDAALLADTLTQADLRGVHSHGVLRVPEYVVKLRKGGVDPKGRPRVAKDSAAALLVDGGNSMGQIGAAYAMNLAIKRAQTSNVAVAAVGGSNHCGAMAYYAMQALPHDMIGLATTNALPTMAPWGGLDKIVGINPLAIAMPAGGETPIVLDTAFSGSSHGKIRVFHQKGASIPPNWAFDAHGKPTTDPAKAIEGLLQPIGEYKGVGLAITMGILSAVLSGASYGTDLGNMVDGATPGHDSHFFLALKVAAFGDPTQFKKRVDGLTQEIQASRRVEGVDQLYAPGQLEAATAEGYRRDGIPLNDTTRRGLADVARELGVDSSPLDA